MNTIKEQPNDVKEFEEAPESENLPAQRNPSSPRLFDSISSLSGQLANEKDERKEERFYWIFLTAILLDLIVLPTVPWYTGLFVSTMEIVFLIGLAHRLGVDVIVKHLENAMDRLKFGKGDE